MFELGEDLFNGVQIGALERQEKKPCPGAANRGAHRIALMAAEIVHDDDVTRLEVLDQELLKVKPETLAVDWSVEYARCNDLMAPQRDKKCHGLPVFKGNGCQ